MINVDNVSNVDNVLTVGVAPGHELVAVAEPDLELPDADHLLLGPGVGAAGRVVDVEVAAHHVHVAGERLEVLEGVARAEVAGAEDVLDAARHQQLAELGRQRGGAVRDVQVAKHQDQHGEEREKRPLRDANAISALDSPVFRQLRRLETALWLGGKILPAHSLNLVVLHEYFVHLLTFLLNCDLLEWYHKIHIVSCVLSPICCTVREGKGLNVGPNRNPSVLDKF